jgi:hypothetical protein
MVYLLVYGDEYTIGLSPIGGSEVDSYLRPVPCGSI